MTQGEPNRRQTRGRNTAAARNRPVRIASKYQDQLESNGRWPTPIASAKEGYQYLVYISAGWQLNVLVPDKIVEKSKMPAGLTYDESHQSCPS